MRFFVTLLVLAGCGADAPAPPPATRSIHVRLVDAKGEPASGNVWWAEDAEASFGKSNYVSEGTVTLENVPTRPIVVVALPNGFVVPSTGWPRIAIAADTTELTLTLDIGATRTLTVAGWKMGSRGTVRLAAVADIEPSHHGVEEDGTIELEGLRPGVRYNLYVREDDGDRCALLRNLSADEPWPLVELGPGGTITGRVVYPEGCDWSSVALMVGVTAMMDAQKNDDGTFRITGVPPGTWRVVAYVTHEGDYYDAFAETRPGRPITLDLRK